MDCWPASSQNCWPSLTFLLCRLKEQQRQAAEAERRRREEEQQRREAEVAEAARRAEEAARRAAAAQRAEEAKRRRREAKRRSAVQRLYFDRWRMEARRRVDERVRARRRATALKACRVGIKRQLAPSQRAGPFAAAAAAAAAQEAAAAVAPAAPSPDAAAAAHPLDLASLAAGLLRRRSPASEALYWKLVVLAGGHATGPAASEAGTLLQWLRLQLGCGRPAQPAGAAGTVYVEGPLDLEPAQGGGGCALRLSTCLAWPNGRSQPGTAALAGAAGIVLAVGGPPNGASAGTGLGALFEALPRGAPALPVLVLASAPAAAEQWELAAAAAAPHPTMVVSVAAEQRGQREGVDAAAAAPAFSQSALARGLRWLAANAPPQPLLVVTRLEAVARDALDALLRVGGARLGNMGWPVRLVAGSSAVLRPAVS